MALAVVLLLPPPAGTSTAGILVPCIAGAVTGIVLWRQSEQLPQYLLPLSIALGTMLIGVGLYYGSDMRSGGAIVYLWVVFFAFAMTPFRLALAQVGLIGVTYAAVLALRHEPTAAPRWVITLGTLTVAGILISRTISALDRAAQIAAARQSELLKAEERFRTAFDDASIGMTLTTLEGTALQANDALARLTKTDTADIVGVSFRDFTTTEDGDQIEAAIDSLIAGDVSTYQAEHPILRPDGSSAWVSVNCSVVRDGLGVPMHLIWQMYDVTARRSAERDLAQLALRDPLTGLPNRVLFTDKLRGGLARLAHAGGSVTVMFLDLDHFKAVNDSLGHAIGDHLLVAAAERLRRELRPSDTVARFGGDEFTIMCEHIDEQLAEAVAERLLATLSRPFNIEGHTLTVSGSIGIAMATDPAASPESLLREADAEMYKAKEHGRARFSTSHRIPRHPIMRPELEARASRPVGQLSIT